MEYILASASPRRKELLSLILPQYKIIPADIDEEVFENESPREYVCRMAYEKAAAVGSLYPKAVTVGCDTIVEVAGNILGKPKNPEQAADMLSRLSGRVHQVMTAVTMFNNVCVKSFLETTQVEFWSLREEQIDEYICKGESLDKAGAYAVQGFGALLVKSIQGDFYNVVGLPVSRLYRELKQLEKIL